MTDIFSKEKRREIMSRVKCSNTKPEIAVRTSLHRAGFRFRLHQKDLPGRPDIVLPRYKVLVLVHGCFWHQHADCNKAKLPAINVDFWRQKLNHNRARDESNKTTLESLGWKVIIIWECLLIQGTLDLLNYLEKARRS